MTLPDPPRPLANIDQQELRRAMGLRVSGRVSSVVGLLIEGSCPGVAVGDLVEIHSRGAGTIVAEVIGLRGGQALLVALGDARGISNGDRLSSLGVAATIPCSDGLLGRVIDARGEVLDRDAGPVPGPFVHRHLYADPPAALSRRPIDTPMAVGIRAIDGLLTLGRGQRVGIMAGPGLGKSRLMGMIAQFCEADIVVAALIGERGREVGEFIEKVLPAEARRRSVVIAATSDRSPLERVRGAFVASAVAEHFSAQGKRVLLLMDSLTRFAMAQRELGLSAGEPPATRGYTPSVFAMLPRLLERAGNFHNGGSITGIYTVLVEGDDLSDPVADAARAILDGHIILDRTLAARGHYPAINIMQSVSRVAEAVLAPAHVDVAMRFRSLVADVHEARELVSIGAYVPGAAPALDRALQVQRPIDAFLRQSSAEVSPFPQTVKRMAQIAGKPG